MKYIEIEYFAIDKVPEHIRYTIIKINQLKMTFTMYISKSCYYGEITNFIIIYSNHYDKENKIRTDRHHHDYTQGRFLYKLLSLTICARDE